MSAKSYKYEMDVAEQLDIFAKQADEKRGRATHSKAGVKYSDVLVEAFGKKAWCEVKMSHTDNLSNPRVFYANQHWQTTYKTPAASYSVEILNKSKKALDFIVEISKFSGIPVSEIRIPTTPGGLKEAGAVPLSVMKKYFGTPNINRYIAQENNFDLASVVTEHYTLGKEEPAYYMQAGDDFYMISRKNPLGFKGVPLLSGRGDFKVRIATRRDFYEVQAEIKINDMGSSKFSVAPGTKKKNPFSTLM